MNKNIFWNRIAIVVAFFLGFAGIMHFASPEFFNDIVPPWLPPSEAFWTYVSGLAEITVSILLFRRSTRRIGALLAVALFIAVYPANIYMTWDWRNEVASQQFISWIRLPFQFVFIWAAWRIAQANTERPTMPGDIT
jgi:uncharacterized membrane protein